MGIYNEKENHDLCVITKSIAMNNKLNPWAAIGVALLYFLFVFASCFIGFLHPACWAYFSVLAAILALGPYFWLAATALK